MTKDDFMALAWRDFLMFAIESKELCAEFEKDTGMKFIAPATDPFGALIDQATGLAAEQENVAMAFAIWATRTQWGWDEAPEAFRKHAEELEVSASRLRDTQRGEP